MPLKLNGDNSVSTPAFTGDDADTGLQCGTNELKLVTGGTEAVTVDSSGNVGIGTTSPEGRLHVVNTQGGSTGRIIFDANVTSGYNTQIDATDTGLEFTAKSNSRGFVFNTGSTPTEKMRMASDGVVLIGKTTNDTSNVGIALNPIGVGSFTRSGTSAAVIVNKSDADGTLILFRQADTTEGKISVSGTTVSLQGGHLARWAQLAGGAERIEILRGSVLSNLDEMCEWGDEDNEQLNRIEVSTVEGDPNVAGVFESWDDDDEDYTNDLNVAMTGDFVIRIAQGTTVARGDLLMSAGDGTAKPQDDDIIRSKTIAKVTSTTVSTTYSDGSYCVPCVLMAC
jgi:hypothetical protein